MIPHKVNLWPLIKEVGKIYVDSNDNILLSDLIFFFLLPILVAIVFGCFINPEVDLTLVYTSVAFLSGFVFSAFILLLNIVPIIKDLEDGPKKIALEINVREITLISLFVFLMGLGVLIIGLIDFFISASRYDCIQGYSVIPKSTAVFGFTSMVLHLLMLTKRLFVTLIATK